MCNFFKQNDASYKNDHTKSITLHGNLQTRRKERGKQRSLQAHRIGYGHDVETKLKILRILINKG